MQGSTSYTFDELRANPTWTADVQVFFGDEIPGFIGYRDMYDLSVTQAWANWIDQYTYPGCTLELGSEAGDALASSAIAKLQAKLISEGKIRYAKLVRADAGRPA